MKDTLPTLLKFIGALAVTTAIFFALSPDDHFNDEVVNRSMEFLGTKLLAMVPEEQKRHVQKEFDHFSEQTLNGKVSDEHVKDVAVMILNAEAEGKKLGAAQVDSILDSIREVEIAKVEADIEKEENANKRREELVALSESVQDFAKFEKEWQRMVPLPPLVDSTLPPPARRPLYRVKPNFVVEIDTVAIADIAAAHAEAFAANAPQANVVHSGEVNHSLRVLSRELPRLKIEMRRMQMHLQMADSVHRVMTVNPELAGWSMAWSTGMADSIKQSVRAFRQLQIEQARLHRHMADSTRRLLEADGRRYRYATPPPPPARTWVKPEKPKTPQ